MLPVVPLSVAEARTQFAPAGAYLNTATYGLPPHAAWAALQAAASEWRGGRCGFDGWDLSVGAARASFARLLGVRPEDVAVGANVSALVGLVAGALPPGARVLAPEEDFTSLLFPFLARRELDVTTVPLDRLAEAVDGETDLIACSAVQSADGSLADLEALEAAAAHHGAATLLDATQGAGWLPLDAARFDFVACAGYKWLLGPRGTAFLTIRPERAAGVTPAAAGWYAGDEPMATLYGPPLRLAADARRFDVSPAWLSWVGQAPALTLLERVGIPAIHAHDVGLANAFRAGLDLPPGDSAIVALDVPPGTGERLERAGVMAAGRGGRLRFSFHLSTSEADVAQALTALAA